MIPALANNSTKKIREVKRRGPGLQNRIKNPPPMIPAAMATILYIPVETVILMIKEQAKHVQCLQVLQMIRHILSFHLLLFLRKTRGVIFSVRSKF